LLPQDDLCLPADGLLLLLDDVLSAMSSQLPCLGV
jgi:hypothetical protein